MARNSDTLTPMEKYILYLAVSSAQQKHLELSLVAKHDGFHHTAWRLTRENQILDNILAKLNIDKKEMERVP